MDACAIQVTGLVQGVGFRPFVHALALKHGLQGIVRNHTGGVFIEVQGDQRGLNLFWIELRQNAPPLAKIENIVRQPALLRTRSRFEILSSEFVAGAEPVPAPDSATCLACLAELSDPADPRHNYAFSNCTHCGPRFTIIESLPYDRERTSLSVFPMCPDCAAEYRSPGDRRFHAQATVCARCGPKLFIVDGNGAFIRTDDPLTWTADLLNQGKIAAIKGLGGFHLACNSSMDEVVNELRRRKRRQERPFAIMVRDIDAVESICRVHIAERELLLSERCPIVLLKKAPDAQISEAVAPNGALLGVMLPYTPLHHLLLRKCSNALVMTSGNSTDEPIVFDNDEAVRKLKGIADFFLLHDRPIQMRCDDSIARVVKNKAVLLRRARGFSPAPIRLPFRCQRPILALGGQQKVTFALGREKNAILSHHIGDLDGYENYREYELALEHYQRLFMFKPEMIVHDLHPDYASTRLAIQLATQQKRPCLGVQHHHAHMASCMAENGLREQVIGVTFDGTGFGGDGTVWGGEFLVGEMRSFERAAHLRAVSMPGGAQAILEPWRMAVSHLADAGEEADFLRLPDGPARTIEKMIRKRLNSPLTSSCGRFLDAAAAIIGLRHSVGFEGQAAMELEGIADGCDSRSCYPFEIQNGNPLQIDTRPIISAIVRDSRDKISQGTIAGRVHRTLIEIIGVTCGALRARFGLNTVVLSGGVFCNAILSAGATDCLEADGFKVFTHSQVPPNDGGLSLGQLAVAAAREGSK